MKRTVSVIALVLAMLMLVMCFAACSEEEKKADATEAVSMDGTYKLTQMIQNGTDMSSQISTMESAGMSIDLVVKGDKATLMGQEISIKDGVMSDGNEDVPFTFDGSKITLEKEGTKMVFEKQ